MESISHQTSSNKFLSLKILPEVKDLPDTGSDQGDHSQDGEPLDPLVRALVCITQPLFPLFQVFHFAHDLLQGGLDPPELGLHGLQFLRLLDR